MKNENKLLLKEKEESENVLFSKFFPEKEEKEATKKKKEKAKTANSLVLNKLDLTF